MEGAVEILIVADSLEEARTIAKSKVPKGEYVLSETVALEAGISSIKKFADTEEHALALAKSKVPHNAEVLEIQLLDKPISEAVEVQAATEGEARALVVRCRPGKKLLKVHKVRERRETWEGIVLLTMACVCITYRWKAELRVTIGRARYHDLLELVRAAPSEEARKEAVQQFLTQRNIFHPERGEQISYCPCGYPTWLHRAHGEDGPILEMLVWDSPMEEKSFEVDGQTEWEVTHHFGCPSCGRHITSLKSTSYYK